MKRKRIAGGLLVAGCLAFAQGCAQREPAAVGQRELQAISALSQQYPGIDAEDVRFAAWNRLPLPQVLSPEERQQEIVQIDQQAAVIEKEKQLVSAAIADVERTVRVVQNDFSKGRLSRQDADMLLRLFREKADRQRRSADELSQRLARLQERKQKLSEIKEPDAIEYARVEVDHAWRTYRKTVFYNVSQQRVLTDEEVGKLQVPAGISVSDPPTLSRRAVKHLLLAAGVSATVLIFVWMQHRSSGFGKLLIPRKSLLD
ncbi:hypothetical protein [Effusibacillus pohliae]|uniref:hypothetical protein n=1 Tax=Effusibacillus pohliae TaxID=232270 RepID=UPI00038280B7|nr:hypothetical protein [Effusibacillus pohliae]